MPKMSSKERKMEKMHFVKKNFTYHLFSIEYDQMVIHIILQLRFAQKMEVILVASMSQKLDTFHNKNLIFFIIFTVITIYCF